MLQSLAALLLGIAMGRLFLLLRRKMMNGLESIIAMDFSRLRTWSRRGGMAILDQALFSGSNFILNILLVRWLAPADYGAFAVVFAIFLFLSGFYNALLLEPMSVLGPGRYPDQIDTYLAIQVRIHFALTIPLGIMAALVGLFLQASHIGDIRLAQALIGSGLALPFMLLLWLVRRMFYVLKRPADALLSSGLYGIFLFTGIWMVHRNGADSSLLAFGLMGAASLLSGLWVGGRFITQRRQNVPLAMSEILRAHWDFGKWLVATAILSLGATYAQTFLAAGMINLEAAGALRAMQNFMQPMERFVTAIALLGLPALAYDFGRGHLTSLRRKGIFITVALTGMAVAYEIAIWLLAGPLEQLVYGGRYAAYAGLIGLIGLVAVFTALSTGFSLILRAIQKPQIYLIIGIVTSVVGLSSALILTWKWGVAGAAASLVLTYFARFVVVLHLYRRWFPKN